MSLPHLRHFPLGSPKKPSRSHADCSNSFRSRAYCASSFLLHAITSCWSTNWRRVRTTPGILRSTPASRASSNSNCGPSADCRWAARRCCVRRRWPICWVIFWKAGDPQWAAGMFDGPEVKLHLYGENVGTARAARWVTLRLRRWTRRRRLRNWSAGRGRTAYGMTAVRKRKAESQRRSDTWLLLIGVFKLLKGVGLVIAGIGLLRLLHRDIAEAVQSLDSKVLRVDPG